MKKIIQHLSTQELTKQEQKYIFGGNTDCNPSWERCCGNDDHCMDPYSEDNGQYYSVCQGGYCVDIYY